jgi:hypothetical protein
MFMDTDQLAATIHHVRHVAGYPGVCGSAWMVWLACGQ